MCIQQENGLAKSHSMGAGRFVQSGGIEQLRAMMAMGGVRNRGDARRGGLYEEEVENTCRMRLGKRLDGS